jgi:hypothetical protein
MAETDYGTMPMVLARNKALKTIESETATDKEKKEAQVILNQYAKKIGKKESVSMPAKKESVSMPASRPKKKPVAMPKPRPKNMNKGGYANCGASVSPTQSASQKMMGGGYASKKM